MAATGGLGGGIWVWDNSSSGFSSTNITSAGGSGGSGNHGGSKGTNGTQGSDGGTAGQNLCSTNSICGNATCVTAGNTGWGVGAAGGNNKMNCEDDWWYCETWDNAFQILGTMTNNNTYTDLWGNTSDRKYTNGSNANYCVKSPKSLTCYVFGTGSAPSCSDYGIDNVTISEAVFDGACTGDFWTNIATGGYTSMWNSGTNTLSVTGINNYTYHGNSIIGGTTNCMINASCNPMWSGGGGGTSGNTYGRPFDGDDGASGATGTDGEKQLVSTTGGTDPSDPEIVKGYIYSGSVMQERQEQSPVSPLAAQNLNLHPNPTSDKVYVEFSSLHADAYTVTVTDMAGKELFKNSLIAAAGLNNCTIDVTEYAKGNYIVNVKNLFGNQKVKFVKE